MLPLMDTTNEKKILTLKKENKFLVEQQKSKKFIFLQQVCLVCLRTILLLVYKTHIGVYSCICGTTRHYQPTVRHPRIQNLKNSKIFPVIPLFQAKQNVSFHFSMNSAVNLFQKNKGLGEYPASVFLVFV
jgi:hypothetical protein